MSRPNDPVGIKESGKSKPKDILALLVVAAIFAIVFGFVMFWPALVAAGKIEPNVFTIIYSVIIYLVVWLIIAGTVLESISQLYGIRRPYFLPEYPKGFRLGLLKTTRKTVSGLVTVVIISYLFTLHAYAVAYVFISHIDKTSFCPGPLNVISAWYFSVATAATVGFGDITAQSDLARLVVTSEILVSIFYVVFIFSILPRRPDENRKA